MDRRENLPDAVVGFVERVFAVIIGVSLTAPFNALKQGELKFWSFEAATLVGTYAVIIHSWVGYHDSVRHQPLTRGPGKWRFVLDLLILLDYFVLVYFFDRFDVVATAFAALFGLYFVWSFIKMLEYRAWTEWPRFVTRFPSLLLAVVVAVGLPARWGVLCPEQWDWVCLLVLIACVFWYRVGPDWLHQPRAEVIPQTTLRDEIRLVQESLDRLRKRAENADEAPESPGPAPSGLPPSSTT